MKKYLHRLRNMTNQWLMIINTKVESNRYFVSIQAHNQLILNNKMDSKNIRKKSYKNTMFRAISTNRSGKGAQIADSTSGTI